MLDTETRHSIEKWQGQRQETEAALADAFVRYAIDNRGMMASARRGAGVATELCQLAFDFVAGNAGKHDVAAAATRLAEQGLALVTASQMMRTLNTSARSDAAILIPLADFQLLFLENLANTREVIQQRTQESSQTALQQALHEHLKEQRRSHQSQQKRNLDLNQILLLNARLALATDDTQLLDEAVNGICAALSLIDVTLFERHHLENHWSIRTTTAVGSKPGHNIDPDVVRLLDQTLARGEITIHHQTDRGQDLLSVIALLRVGQAALGAMLCNIAAPDAHGQEEFLILIRTFAQNLAALWHNLHLLRETRQRARDLEILHGRYIDRLWRKETAALVARYGEDGLEIKRNPDGTAGSEPALAIPLRAGDHTFGAVILPQATLDQEETAFVRSLVREMGNALHNAHLLQTTRSYSNQFSLAADVSRAATTILDRDQLTQEVVELIRSRFDFYYVGLFLVDEKGEAAVLKAGTGEAGRRQVEQGHRLAVGGQSMIGASVADGRARVEQDVSQAQAFARNPLLPDTRSELALPLRARGRTIGALTVQSAEKGAFVAETITVLQSLADQLAIAIENVELLTQTQTNLEETSRLYNTSRHISEAADAGAVFRSLIGFVAQSGLADVALVIAADLAAPDYFVIPASWSRQGSPDLSGRRFLRDRFQFSERLSNNELILINDGKNDPELDPVTRRLFETNNLSAAALVPIHVESQWLGALALLRTDPTPLNEQELQPFLTLADQAAVILANQQLLRQTESLYRIGRALNQAITRDDALAIAVAEVARYTGASRCRIVLYDKSTGTGEVAAESIPSGLAGSVELPMLGDFAYEYLSREGRPLLLQENDARAPADTVRRHVQQFGARASLLVPAASQQELMGFMALDSLRGKRPFSPNNIIFAQTVLDHLTTQVENIKLLEEALIRAQELITLNQIQSHITGVLDLGELARVVYEQVGRLLDNTVFILARYEAESHIYEPILCIHEGRPFTGERRRLQPDEPLYQLLQGDRPVLADHTSPLLRTETNPVLQPAPRSSLWVPMRLEGTATGLLSIQSPEIRAYKENDVQLLRSIATQTSLAIANARLFARIQASNEELRQLDHLKTQFLANMSHELRTPLNSIIGFSRVILKGIDGPITPQQEEDLTSIYNNGHHLLMLINEILDMAKIEAGKMTLSFEMVDLVEVAKTVYTMARGLIKTDQVELIWAVAPTLPLIEADSVRIRQILLNLLSNAVKYTERGTIHLQIHQAGGQVHIAVRDTGIGIAAEDYHKVFTAFEQVDSSTTRAAGGTGLGLPITKSLVEMHQGQIWFDSQENKGTTFHVKLPIRQNC
ncbi:MAG TPA: GAF domain-containing protein [Anaerolineae bacterium]